MKSVLKPARRFVGAAAMFLLAGCGGGSGGGSTVAMPDPSITVNLSATSGSATVVDYATVTNATVTASGVPSATITTPVVADLSYDKTVFASVTATPGATANSYVVTATTLPNLAIGSHSSTISFRLCQEAACTHVYSGSSVSYAYNLTVNLGEWTTFQRTASHLGYLPITLDTSKFAKLWSWTNPDNNFISAVVAGNGSAYFSAWPWGKIYSFNEQTGAQNWMYDLTGIADINTSGALAYDNGVVYAPFHTGIGTGNAKIRALDAATGAFKADSATISQVPDFNSPVIYQNEMFYSQGYYGGKSFKYSLPSGATAWASVDIYSNIFGAESPAVDQNFVYYSTGFGLAIYNKSDGSLVANVSEVRLVSGGGSNYSAPIITPAGHVLINNGQVHDNIEAVDPVSKAFVWKTPDGYPASVQPVVSGNVIYAMNLNYTGSIATYKVQALSDTDGSVLWSWTMPATDNLLMENMIVCDNLLFVSSDKAIYAIDLKTHQTVWTFAAHGRLSLSSNYILYAAANDFGPVKNSGTLTAIKLK